MIANFFRFLTKLLLWCVVLIVLAFVWMRWAEPRLLTVTEAEVRSPVLPGMADGLRVAQITDTHFGFAYDAEDFARVVTKLNALSPHIVVFTGDLFEEYDKYPADDAAIIEALSAITAPHGKYAVLGNHDHGLGAAEDSIRILESGGFTVLSNESVTLSALGITLTGIDDCFFGQGGSFDPAVFSWDGFDLVLCHEPDLFTALAGQGLDLMLSGHTHGGQVRLPILGELILPYLGREYPMGSYSRAGADLFVSRGLGTSKLPLRFLCPPEIALITLKTA
ncbi:MAG: metallophosphoesterase [Ruminococcaceae bacterium]|nr:metallophosphoesterase [Oscillospiraceae bacterium]